ncbi:hypothetical protein NYE70_11365 [Paenibacillus sp. FSL R5-0407]|uniref:hypothetical protein n=1 Tax=Paenibacillus sp. FSL R5-0407 TaxID=2975320 RepID=UPI0030F5E9E7
MPKLDFEIKESIPQLLEDEYITRGEARILNAYFSSVSRKEAAKRLNIEINSLQSMLAKLVRDGVLIRISKGVLELTDDAITIKRKTPNSPPPVVETPLDISNEERKWMLQHYDGRKRSEAAKKLGRSKYDICRMAIALGLDRKN